MKKPLPRIYLIGFAVLVLLGLFWVSSAYWENFFGKQTSSNRTEMVREFTQQWQPKPVQKSEVSLSINPKTNSFKLQTDFDVEVVMDSRGKEIWGTDLAISFDPTQVRIDKVQAGNYIPKPLVLENRVDKEKGVINFSVGTLQAAKGKGVVATLQVRPIREGETTISFLPQTQVAMKGKENSAVIEFHNFKFNLPKEK